MRAEQRAISDSTELLTLHSRSPSQNDIFGLLKVPSYSNIPTMRFQWLPALAFLVACSSDETPQTETDAGYVVPSLASAGDSCRADWQEAYPCDEGFTAGESEIGECKPGFRLCQDLVWGECTSQSFPNTETCNRLDDDCDGDPDEELKDSCGRCDAVPAIRDCFGQDCERGFDLASSSASCTDNCCDCVVFEPGSEASISVTFDVCEIFGEPQSCSGEGIITMLKLRGELEGLSLEVRAASSQEDLAKESFSPVAKAFKPDGSSWMPVSGQETLLEVRVSLDAAAKENGILCRIEPDYQIEI